MYQGTEVLQGDLLQALRGKGRKGNGSAVVPFRWFGFLGETDRDNERGFPEGGYRAGVDRLLKNGPKNGRQGVSAVKEPPSVNAYCEHVDDIAHQCSESPSRSARKSCRIYIYNFI